MKAKRRIYLMYKIIALIGESGSGKDTIMQRILTKNSNLNEIISCTTRPKREGEIEGVNYYYLTTEQFTNKVINNEMLESTCFNNWFYGTSYDSLKNDTLNIGVFNPTGIESLLHNKNVNVQVFYIKASDKNRLLRQLNRENEPNINEIIRRYKTDCKNFYNLNFNYIELKNNNSEDLNYNIKYILNYIDKWEDQ